MLHSLCSNHLFINGVLKVRVNPSTSQVEIDLSMDVHSSNYDPEFGSKLRMTKQVSFFSFKVRFQV